MSNFAAAGPARALGLTGDGWMLSATLIDYSTNNALFVQQTSLHAERLGVTQLSAIVSIGLFTIDKANGRLIYIYRNATNVFALPFTVTGDTITAGTFQDLGPRQMRAAAPDQNNTLSEAIYASADNDRFSGGFPGRIILADWGDGEQHGANFRMQILTVNSSGVISRGNITQLSATVQNPRIGAVSVTNKSPSKIIISGISGEIPYVWGGCMIEYTVSGATVTGWEKYIPFRDVRCNHTDAPNRFRNYAIEHPAKPGEFLFLQQFSGADVLVGDSFNDLMIWWGTKYDDPASNNIIGIALENSANGRVRVQTTAKYLPGMGSFTPHRALTIGTNGSLTQILDSRLYFQLPYAYSPNGSDLMFFGASAWR